MTALKSAILIACIMGIISTFADSAVCGETFRKPMKLIMVMTLILSIALPASKSDFELTLDASTTDVTQTDEYISLDNQLQKTYNSELESRIESAVSVLLKNRGYNVKKICIACDNTEYNSIEIKSCKIYISQQDVANKSEIHDIVTESLQDIPIDFEVEDSSEN